MAFCCWVAAWPSVVWEAGARGKTKTTSRACWSYLRGSILTSTNADASFCAIARSVLLAIATTSISGTTCSGLSIFTVRDVKSRWQARQICVWESTLPTSSWQNAGLCWGWRFWVWVAQKSTCKQVAKIGTVMALHAQLYKMGGSDESIANIEQMCWPSMLLGILPSTLWFSRTHGGSGLLLTSRFA